jgi:hypothetical protein
MIAGMYLAHAELIGVAPFGHITFPFRGADGEPRMVTVVQGAGGVGKTALLQILSCTRPGHATVLVGRSMPGADAPAHAMCEWILDDDDHQRPHPLTVVTPNMQPRDDDEGGALRRREQALFDRRAKERGGFVFLTMSSLRWFSKQAVVLHAPLRTVAHYDVKATASFDDAAHSDLTRETKQALAYAAIAAALMPHTQRDRNRLRAVDPAAADTRLLGRAMHEMVDAMAGLAGWGYEGIDPASLEPTFSTPTGRRVIFERLPNRVRHLVALAALPVRTLWAAYPGRDPRTAQGVVAIDEVDLHQDDAIAERIVPTLRTCLPRVQWILTTASVVVAASVDATSVLALRRLPDAENVELYLGDQARVH